MHGPYNIKNTEQHKTLSGTHTKQIQNKQQNYEVQISAIFCKVFNKGIVSVISLQIVKLLGGF
jgi:hypothetical protein